MPRTLSLLSLSPVMKTKGISRVAGFFLQAEAEVVSRLARHHHVGEDQVGSRLRTSASAWSALEAVITYIRGW